MTEYEISDWNYIMSSLGNAYFSGITFEQLWIAVSLSSNREELDAAVDAQIKLVELGKNMKKKDGRLCS